MRKMATGVAKHDTIIDLRDYSKGVDWVNSNLAVGISNINISNNTNKIVASFEKIDDNKYKIVSYTDNSLYIDDFLDEKKISWSAYQGSGSWSKKYIGTDFVLYSYMDGSKCYAKITYRVNGGSWNMFSEFSLYDGHSYKFLNFEDVSELEIKIDYVAYVDNDGYDGYIDVLFNIEGYSSVVGDKEFGTVEWFAYEQ